MHIETHTHLITRIQVRQRKDSIITNKYLVIIIQTKISKISMHIDSSYIRERTQTRTYVHDIVSKSTNELLTLVILYQISTDTSVIFYTYL